MADTSYLFGGSSPSSTTAPLSDTTSQLPAWLQEYTRGLAGQATAVAGQAYSPYTAPTGVQNYGAGTRIASQDPLQTQAYSLTQQNIGDYRPYLDTASQLAPGISSNYIDQQARDLAQQSAATGVGAFTDPNMVRVAGTSAANNLSGFRDAQARQLAQITVPQVMTSYMNPYVNQVVARIAQLNQRNLSENLLPQVNQTFTGAGQFGGTRNAEFTNRAVRDANESILGQQAQALQQGFTQQQSAAMADLQRQQQGLLSESQLAQQSTLQDLQRQQQGYGSAAQLAQQSAIQDMNRRMQGLQTGTTSAQQLAMADLQRQASLGQLTQQLDAQQAGLLDTAGQSQQAQQQRALDLAYNDFLQQRDYQKNQLGFLSEIVRGLPSTGAKYTSSSAAPSFTSQISPLTAAAQGFLGAYSIANQPQQSVK